MKTEELKTCKKCASILPRSGFYGTLSECKTCTKKRVALYVAEKKKDPQWVIAERKRCRLKSRKYRDEGRAKALPKGRDNKRRKANGVVNNAIRSGRLQKQPCTICGEKRAQAHHEDYSKPLDVIWYCVRHHNDRHIEIRDAETLGLPIPPPTI